MEPLFTPGNCDPQKYLCLLGYPVDHSLSPKIHTTAAKALGLDYQYEAINITKDKIKDAIDTIRMFNIRGANLTMPLKDVAVPYLDELSDTAKLCKSVNTIVNDNGKLIGHTTDGKGFMDSLAHNDINIIGHSMCVLGAGGAAKSIIAQAAYDGLRHISVFKRMDEKFNSVVDFAVEVTKATRCQVSVHDFADEEDFRTSLSASNLVCNATNVGMERYESLISPELLSKDLVTVDIIYHPSETRLLKEAKKSGAKTLNGKPMLLYQAAYSFKLWTGHDMPVDEVIKNVGELA